MINQKHFQGLKKSFSEWEKKRQEVQNFSSQALSAAKQAIFAFHRDDKAGGEAKLKSAIENLQKATVAQAKSIASQDEGIYKAALEEYVEAELFQQFLKKEKIGPLSVAGVKISPETYLGGLADLVGEILRYALKQATERNFVELKRAAKISEEIMAVMIEFNFTGYLRTKYDQAKGARRKMEEMMYEMSLRIKQNKD